MARGIVHECLVCHERFIGRPRNKYCSAKCYHEAQRAGLARVGIDPWRIYPCAQCGKRVNRTPARRRNGEQCDKVFCSRACYNAYRAAEIDGRAILCANCGAHVRGGGVSRKYCSQACRIAGRKPKPVTCKNCGTVFCAIKPMHRSGDVTKLVAVTHAATCSRECHIAWIRNNLERKLKIGLAFKGEKHPNWQGGKAQLNNISSRGPNWQAQRSKALVRCHNRCVDCGISNDECAAKFGRSLDVDHIVPFHNFDSYLKANRLSNLAARCASCHRKAEAKRHDVQMVLPIQDSERRRHKGWARHERHPRAKLTWPQVRNIRKRSASGVSIKQLATEYPVSGSTIHAIVRNKIWRP